MCEHRQASDDAERAATAALQRVKEFRLVRGVCDARSAVRGYDLGFQQVRGPRSEFLREAAESASLDEARDPNRQATAALHVATGMNPHRVVHASPDRPCSDGHRRYGCVVRSLGDESIVKR
jgi:hypothetical protein